MRTDEERLSADPYFGDETDIRCQTVKIGKIRKEQTCVPISGEPHAIQSGTRARIERGVIDGEWRTAYLCVECLDAWLQEIDDECADEADDSPNQTEGGKS